MKASLLRLFMTLLGMLLITESCNLFKRELPEVVYQEEESFHYSTENCETECPYFFPEQFESHLTQLFELQALLINDVIALSFSSASEDMLEMARCNIYENVNEIGTAFSTVYGARVGTQIEELFNKQAQLALMTIYLTHCQQSQMVKETIVQSYANGCLIVEFLNILNPYFSADAEKYMMDEHVALQADQIAAYSHGHLARGEELKDRSAAQFKEMAAHISKAVYKQMTSPNCQ